MIRKLAEMVMHTICHAGVEVATGQIEKHERKVFIGEKSRLIQVEKQISDAITIDLIEGDGFYMFDSETNFFNLELLKAERLQLLKNLKWSKINENIGGVFTGIGILLRLTIFLGFIGLLIMYFFER